MYTWFCHDRLLSQLEEYKTVWLTSHLPQRLEESVTALSHIVTVFVPSPDSTKA